MDKQFEFSIITPFFNSEIYLKDCIESVLNQSLNFNNIQLILINDGSTDSSLDIAESYQKKFPENIIVLSQEHSGQSKARNLGLNYANGKFINFLDSDDKLSLDTLEKVLDFLKNNEISIVSIPLLVLGDDEEEIFLNKKFDKNRIVNVYEEFYYPQISISSCFIKSDLFKDLNFDETVLIGEDLLLINKLLINEEKYALLNSTEYQYRIRVDNSAVHDISKSNNSFFTDKTNKVYKELIYHAISQKGFLPKFIKYTIAYDLYKYYNLSTSNVLTKNEFLEFRKSLNVILDYIDDEFIINNFYIPEFIKSFLIYLKNDEFHIEIQNNNVLLKSKDYLINSLKDIFLIVDVIELIDNTLNVSVWFRSVCDYDFLKIKAIKINSDGSNDIFIGKFFSYPTTSRYPIESIGLCWKYDYSVDFKIPIDKNEKSRIYFKLIYDENGNHVELQNPIQFQNYDAGLSKVSNYLIKNNQMVIYTPKNESFEIQPYSFIKSAKLEVISILKMIKDHNNSMFSGIFYHLIFLFMYPFMRNKRIWLFQDRINVADDNAKHLFNYAVNQNDDIKKFFIINKNCDDFIQMKKIDKNIVNHGSFKNKFLYLFAEKMISSHVNHSWLNPFFNPKHPYFNGLLTIEKCFLQHGVIKDDLSSWLRKFFQNLHLFLTSSDYERASIIGDTYNYDDEVVQAFGLPRHDNLKFNVAKKEILFAPTWRKYLVNRAAFEKSPYYFRLNSFLNNERLLESIKNKGYKLVFKPHPDLEQFLDLFTIQGIVEVNTHDSYQTIFNNSAVMITDYSSVFFDFSFLKKPVIYYHEGDDYHYDKGYFDYESMGFGDVIDNEESLVDKIIYYMENNCEMESKYKKRVDEFFKYTDQKNCQRVYDWLYNH